MASSKKKYKNTVARNIENLRFLYRVDVIARVESDIDIEFWRKVIASARPGKKVKFLPADNTDQKFRKTGKTICMRYVKDLNDHFIICVDSDFDNFTRPGTLDVSKHILQTYAYSWENHHCYIPYLQTRWENLNICDFNFNTFLSELSGILYEVLIPMLTLKTAKKKSWNLRGLCGVILSCQVNREGALDNNGQQLLAEIKQKVAAWISKHTQPSKVAKSKMVQKASTEGLSRGNSYLFMQGHCVYDLVNRIGKTLCNGSHDFQNEVLDCSLLVSGYREIDRTVADVKTIL